MTVSTIDICNIAIGRLGGNPIMSLEDGTAESDLCSTHQDQSKEVALETVDWTFARKRARMVPLTGASGEVEGSDFSSRFQLPTNCLVVRKVSADGSFKDTVVWEKEGRTLLTNTAILYIKYTYDVIDPNLYSPGFITLYSTQLAADLSIPLTANVALRTALLAEVSGLIDHAGGADGVQSLPEQQKASRLTNARFRHSRGVTGGCYYG